MASQVEDISFVDPKGNMRRLSRNDGANFKWHLNSFGTLGIIYEMTMKIEPEYGVLKCIYRNVPWDFLLDTTNFEQVQEANDYISYFTDWKQFSMTSVWIGQRIDASNEEYLRLA